MLKWLVRQASAWASSGWRETLPYPPPAAPAAGGVPLNIFRSAGSLSGWAVAACSRTASVRADAENLPDAATQREFGITTAQMQRCRAEFAVLRVAGVGSYVRRALGDDFLDAFLEATAMRLTLLRGAADGQAASGLRRALQDYVMQAGQGHVEDVAATYMRRVYGDNVNLVRMRLAGMGQAAASTMESGYALARAAHDSARTMAHARSHPERSRPGERHVHARGVPGT